MFANGTRIPDRAGFYDAVYILYSRPIGFTENPLETVLQRPAFVVNSIRLLALETLNRNPAHTWGGRGGWKHKPRSHEMRKYVT